MHRSFATSQARRNRRRSLHTLTMVVTCWLALALALAACGVTPAAGANVSATATARAAATGTAAAEATQTTQPVTIAMQLAQRGTVAGGDPQLVATVTVTNHTDAPIHLAGEGCQNSYVHTSDERLHTFAPPVVLQVADAPDHVIWQSFGWIECPSFANQWVDAQTIAAGGAYTETLTCNMTTGYLSAATHLQAGMLYTVWGKVVLWHQRAVEQVQQAINHPDQPGVLWGNDVATEVPFTFQ